MTNKDSAEVGDSAEVTAGGAKVNSVAGDSNATAAAKDSFKAKGGRLCC